MPAQNVAERALGKLTLRVQGPGGTSQTVVLTSACCRIGSGETCTLRLRAPGIRDVHCVIFRGPQQTVVRGLAKETWLNGVTFFESHVAVGDRLQLGRLEIEVLGDERLGDEAGAANTQQAAAASQRVAGSSLSEHFRGARHAAQPALPAPANDHSLPGTLTTCLKDLVAKQTASLSPTAGNESIPLPEPEPKGADASRDPSHPAAPQQEDTAPAAITDALEKLSGVEGRLVGFEERVRSVEQAVGELHASWSAREDQDRPWREERRQAEVAWHQSLIALEGRVAEVAAAIASPPAANEPIADWRQLDERLSVLERLVGQEDQQYGKTLQGLEEVVARVAQVEAATEKAEAASQAIESRLAQVERLELKLAELACQHTTSAEQGASLQQAWDQRRHEWSQQLSQLGGTVDDLRRQIEMLVDEHRSQRSGQSNAHDEWQRRFASLEEQLAAAPSEAPAARAAIAAPSEAAGAEGYRVPVSNHEESARAASSDISTTQAWAPEDESTELTFQQVSQEAPLSTLEVLRRMGTTLDFTDDEAPGGEEPPARLPAPARPAPAPLPTERSKSPTSTGRAEGHASHQEDGEAIEEYMSQLLQRMRGPKAGENAVELSRPPVAESLVPALAEPASEPEPAPVVTSTPPTQFVPRALAPELTADFSAMRALANTTARQAIDAHRRRRQARFTRGKLTVAAIALTISFALLWLSSDGSHVALWSAIASGLVSVYWGGRYILLAHKLRGKAEEAAAEEPAVEESDAVESAQEKEDVLRSPDDEARMSKE
jgi:hypothetical protein